MDDLVALIAHDAKKDDMVLLAKSQYERLKEIRLVATKGTGQLIIARTGLPVKLLQEGPRGGVQQIGSLVATGELAAVVFLRDPLTAQSYEPGLSELLRLCDVHDIPMATNMVTAKSVLNLIFERRGAHRVERIVEALH